MDLDLKRVKEMSADPGLLVRAALDGQESIPGCEETIAKLRALFTDVDQVLTQHEEATLAVTRAERALADAEQRYASKPTEKVWVEILAARQSVDQATTRARILGEKHNALATDEQLCRQDIVHRWMSQLRTITTRAGFVREVRERFLPRALRLRAELDQLNRDLLAYTEKHNAAVDASNTGDRIYTFEEIDTLHAMLPKTTSYDGIWGRLSKLIQGPQ